MELRHNKRRIFAILIFVVVIGIFVSWGIYFFCAVESLPNLRNPGIFDTVREVKFGDVLYGRFTWRVNQFKNRCTEVVYLIPIDPKTGKPGANTSNVIFYAPHFGAQDILVREGAEPYTKVLAEKYGYTVVSLAVHNDPETRCHPTEYYIYKTSGWPALALKAVRHVQRQFGLGNKKIFVLGDSAGGSMTQQMCVNFPSEVDAGIWNGGAIYTPIPKGLQVPMLGMYSWGDSASTPNMGLQGRNAGCPVLTSEVFPRGGYMTSDGYEHHFTSEQAIQMDYAYISGCVELRDKNGGMLPPVNEWPVQFEIDGTSVQLPSAECKKIWDRMPGQSLHKFTDKNSILFYLLPDATPEKMMIFVMSSESCDDVKAKDYMYTAYLQGRAAAMFLLPINDVRSGVLAKSQLAILNEAVKKTNTPSLKISIIGQDVSIQSLYTIAESIKNNNKNIIISPAGSTKHSRNIMLSKLKPGVPIQCYYHDPLEEDSIPNYVNVNIIPKFRHFKNEMEWIQTL